MVFLIVIVGMSLPVKWGQAKPVEEEMLLQQGIEFLENQQIEDAQKVFHEISFQSDRWLDKAIVQMRFQLLEKNYDEVFQIGQLLRKVKRHNEESERLVNLALYLHGNCIFDSSSPRIEDWLLEAATFRFFERFRSTEKISFWDRMRDWESGNVTWSVSRSNSPFLNDLPELKLLPQGGCQRWQATLLDPLAKAKAELELLEKVYAEKPVLVIGLERHEQLTRILILVRMIELKRFLKKDFTAEKAEVESWPLAVIKDLPEPELRYLWALKVPSLKPINEDQTNFVLKKILEPTVAESVDWLALLSIDSLPLTTKINVLKSYLRFRELENDSYLNFKLAQAHWQSQQLKETLIMVRKLLILNDSPLAPAMEDKVVELAADVFSEIQADAKALGAFYASVPRRVWKKYYEKQIRQLALKGETKKLAQLFQVKQSQKVFSDDLIGLLQALGLRNLSKFKVQLTKLMRRGRITVKFQDWMLDFAADSLKVSSQERKSLIPFHEALIELLKSSIEISTKAETEAQQQLLHTFSQFSKNEWVEGNALIRNDVVQVGTVKLESRVEVKNPFEFHVPATLPLRSMIFVPDGLDGTQWKFTW